MNNTFKEPKFNESSFTCPHCQAIAQMDFFIPYMVKGSINTNLGSLKIYVEKRGYRYWTENMQNCMENIQKCMNFYASYANTFCVCQNCNEISIWVDEKMVYPKARLTPLPNEDLPDDIKADYEEASAIMQDSPRGACALLRLALQKLMIHLGEDKNLDRAIKDLMEDEKVDEDVRKALDSVRVIGNSAIHPNELDIKDKPEIALKLFKLINYIAREVITTKKEIREFYEKEIPESAKRENRKK